MSLGDRLVLYDPNAYSQIDDMSVIKSATAAAGLPGRISLATQLSEPQKQLKSGSMT